MDEYREQMTPWADFLRKRKKAVAIKRVAEHNSMFRHMADNRKKDPINDAVFDWDQIKREIDDL